MGNIVAVDPGNTKSAFALIEAETYWPIDFGILDNKSALRAVTGFITATDFVIERVASYGMAVGREVFETCEWIGRFLQAAEYHGLSVSGMYRKEVTLSLCKSQRAGDTNVRRALIDRFASHDLKNGKGTKGNPDWFFGFKADCWSAYAIGVTYLDTKRGI